MTFAAQCMLQKPTEARGSTSTQKCAKAFESVKQHTKLQERMQEYTKAHTQNYKKECKSIQKHTKLQETMQEYAKAHKSVLKHVQVGLNLNKYALTQESMKK